MFKMIKFTDFDKNSIFINITIKQSNSEINSKATINDYNSF